MAVAANVINWPKATQDAYTAAAHRLRVQAAEIERLRGANARLREAMLDARKFIAANLEVRIDAALAPTQETT